MLKQTEYMDFRVVEAKPRTVVDVTNRRSGFLLGQIRWYGPWRQYVLMPSHSTVFNVDCLQEINDVIAGLMEAHGGGQGCRS